MPKKNSNEQEIAISMSDLMQNAPKKNLLPSAPTQGMYEKNSRNNSYGNSERRFFRNYSNQNQMGSSSFDRGSRLEPSRTFSSNLTSSYTRNPEIQSKVDNWRPQNVDGNVETDMPRRQATAPPADFEKISRQRMNPEKRPSPKPARTARPSSETPRTILSRQPRSDFSMPNVDFSNLRKRSENSKNSKNRENSENSETSKKVVPIPPKSLDRPQPSPMGSIAAPKSRSRVEEKSIFDGFQRSKGKEKAGALLNEAAKELKRWKPRVCAIGKPVSDKKADSSKDQKELKNDDKITKASQIGDNAVKQNDSVDSGKTDDKEIEKTETKPAEKDSENPNEKTEKDKENEKEKEPPKKTKKIVLADLIKITAKSDKSISNFSESIKTHAKPVQSKRDFERRRQKTSAFASRINPPKEDLLSSMKKKQLSEAKKKDQQIKLQRQKTLLEEQKTELKRLETLMWAKRKDGAEFFGYYKGSNEEVSASIWKASADKFLENREATLRDGYKKLTVWGWIRELFSLEGLTDLLHKYFSEKLALLPQEKSSEKSDPDETCPWPDMRLYMAGVFGLLVSEFDENRLQVCLEKEKKSVGEIFNLEDEEKLNEFLEKNNLSFLCKDKSVSEILAEITLETKTSNELLSFLEQNCDKKKIKSEPEISEFIGKRVFEAYFEAITPEIQLTACVVSYKNAPKKESKNSEDAPADKKEGKQQSRLNEKSKKKESKDEEPERQICVTTMAPEVREFFEAHIPLLAFLAEQSPKHQAKLLNSFSASWEANGAGDDVACCLLRALHELGAVDYVGVTEWRSSRAEEGREALKQSVLRAVVAFIGGDLEEKQQLLMEEEEQQWSESEYEELGYEE